MKVHLISYNESFLLPQVDAWWRSRFPDVTFMLFDNYSTDNTVELAVAHGGDVMQFKTDGLSDLVHIAIKNDLWKGCQDEWV